MDFVEMHLLLLSPIVLRPVDIMARQKVISSLDNSLNGYIHSEPEKNVAVYFWL